MGVKLREKVNSIADLRALTNISVSRVIETDSYYGDGNGGGSVYKCVSLTSGGYTDDGGATIIGNDGRVYEFEPSDTVCIESYGVRDESISVDETNNIQSFFDYFKTSEHTVATSKSGVTYFAKEIDLSDMKSNCEIRMSCVFKKVNFQQDAFVTFQSQTKPVENVYVKMVLDGNGDNHTFYQPDTGYNNYPVFEYFGQNPPVGYSYPLGTAFYIGQSDYDTAYTDGCVLNLNIYNWGKNGVYGSAVKGLRIESLVADTITLHALGLLAPNNPNKDKYSIVVDYLYTKKTSTVFDISSSVKNNYDYHAICEIKTAIGEECWSNTKISGAWKLNVDSISFINCGTNPDADLPVGDAEKYSNLFKTEQSEHFGINFNKIYSFGGVYTFELNGGTAGSITLVNHESVALELTNSKVDSVKILSEDPSSPSNVLLGIISKSTVDKIELRNIKSDSTTTLRPTSGTLIDYTCILGGSVINELLMSGYRHENFFMVSDGSDIINKVSFTRNQGFYDLYGENNYSISGSAFMTMTGSGERLMVNDGDFENDIEYLVSGNSGYLRDVGGTSVINNKGTIGTKRISGIYEVRDATNVFGSSLNINGNIYEWVYRGQHYWNKTLPTSGTDGTVIGNVVDEDTGSTLDLSNALVGKNYNWSSASSSTTYTTTSPVANGYARCLINTTSEPTVTGATKRAGATWVTGTDMEMMVESPDGTNVYYYFLEL